MKIPANKAIGLVLLAGFLLPSVQLTGCMSAGLSSDATPIDPFPKPNGPKIIPLETDFQSSFHFAEMDKAGRIIQRIPNLILHIARQASDTFGYAFENPKQGLLIRYVETVNRDSSGIWIVGTFKDGQRFPDSTPVRWLPQFPDTGEIWPVGAGRTMELVDPAAEYLTDIILQHDTAAAPIVQGMQKHTAYRFKETAGDTVSYYFFRKGVGLLGFERSAEGKLVAAGSIRGFYTISNR